MNCQPSEGSRVPVIKVSGLGEGMRFDNPGGGNLGEIGKGGTTTGLDFVTEKCIVIGGEIP